MCLAELPTALPHPGTETHAGVGGKAGRQSRGPDLLSQPENSTGTQNEGGRDSAQKVLKFSCSAPASIDAGAQAFQPQDAQGHGRGGLPAGKLGMSRTPPDWGRGVDLAFLLCCCSWSFCEEDKGQEPSPALPPYLPWPVFPVLWAFNLTLG